jgi:hypothetical protein
MKKGFFTMAALLLCGLSLSAQDRSSSYVGINNVNAPIPTPLLDGKKVFISYEIGDVTAFPDRYSGGPERAYNELYQQMKAWGQYELVLDPKDADLIFAVRFVDPPGIEAQIRLGILDAHTHVALWGFVEEVDMAIFKKHRDASFSATVKQLVIDIQKLVTSAPGSQGPKGKSRMSDHAQP